MPDNENMLGGQDPREADRQRQQKAKASYDLWVKWTEGKEEKIRLYLTNSLPPGSLIRAAMRTVEAKRKLWQEALRLKNEAIRECIEAKVVLPANYWQAEYQAYEKFLAAQRIYDAILSEEKKTS